MTMLNTVRFKLFLTFLAITFLVVCGMYAFTRWSLHAGFSEFVQTRQQEKLNNVIEGLSEYYAERKNWNDLASDKRKWIDILLHANPRHRSEIWVEKALNTPNDSWPPVLPEEQQSGQFKPFEWRVMLLNAERQMIFGNQNSLPQLRLIPIQYHDQTIGYLGVAPGKSINQVSEKRFLEKQLQSFILIALIMIVLSAGLAMLLAYRLGKPLKRVTNAAKALAVGQYEVRLPVDSNDELGQLARDFNEMAAALQQSEHARRRWVADISHELRTPLAILRGEIEALQDGIRPLDSAALDLLFNDVMRLNRLTEDLYQLALSDQGTLYYRKQQINPIEILEDDLETLRTEFKNKNIHIIWTNLLPHIVNIYADPDRLSQLFRNLLRNSANYTDQNGQLMITISLGNANLQITFSDSAPGVPERELPKLFDRFYRHGNSRLRHPAGAGLGLAICSNIVKAHNGTIEALPSPLKGLTVCIEFPLSL